MPCVLSSVSRNVENIHKIKVSAPVVTVSETKFVFFYILGDYDDCRLAEQLNMFKPQIIDAAEMLAKARYRSLDKVSWSGGTKRFKATASLTIRDPASGRNNIQCYFSFL